VRVIHHWKDKLALFHFLLLLAPRQILEVYGRYGVPVPELARAEVVEVRLILAVQAHSAYRADGVVWLCGCADAKHDVRELAGLHP
jgi:hypothetical protein